MLETYLRINAGFIQNIFRPKARDSFYYTLFLEHIYATLQYKYAPLSYPREYKL